jgi:hypothetical protein
LDVLVDFLRAIGRHLGKAVLMTAEGSPAHPALLVRRLRYSRARSPDRRSRWWREVSGRHVDGQSGCLGGIGQSFVIRDE